jgi:endonuclease YncB( thermonuclease family)
MSKKHLAATVLLAIGLSISGGYTVNAATTITKVYDGDTITISTGEKVRLLQIDTPELSPAECYGKEARSALLTLLKTPGQVSFKTDPNLDKVDKYGRLLRYLFIGNTNVNLKLVEIGAATPYFYKGDTGRFAEQILKAAEIAKSKSIGLWKKCPGTRLTPTNSVATLNAANSPTVGNSSPSGKCDLNYAGCIPVFAADVDCTDIERLGLAPVKVIGQDIHNLDRDGDGVGCGK